MNPRQLMAMWVGIGAMALSLLFVPHVMAPQPGEVFGALLGGKGASLGPRYQYAPVFAPPAGSVGVEWPRVWLPLSLIAVVTGAAILTLGGRRNP